MFFLQFIILFALLLTFSIIPLFSLDLLHVLLDLPHQPSLILCVEGGLLPLVLQGRLLNERLLLLHHAQPLVLLDRHVLQVHLRVCRQPLEEVQLPVGAPEVIDVVRQLPVVFLFSTLKERA